jgi:hypothetical protein
MARHSRGIVLREPFRVRHLRSLEQMEQIQFNKPIACRWFVHLARLQVQMVRDARGVRLERFSTHRKEFA